MAIVYFDSSAFVKLLVEEDGSDLAAALWDGCDAAVSSRLAYPEVRAALAAAGRADRLSAADQRRAEAAWEDYWASPGRSSSPSRLPHTPDDWPASTRCAAPTRSIWPACSPSVARDRLRRLGSTLAGGCPLAGVRLAPAGS